MKILICPLNWGLGHATRCIPIIRKLMNEGHELVIAADGFPLELLKQQFPSLWFIELPSYRIRYSSCKSQVFAMLRNLPTIAFGIYKEHRWLRKLLKTEHFDQIISDNRFGLWNKKLNSVYITHQLMIKMPVTLKFLEPIAWYLHRAFVLKYNECRIPDDEGEDNLSDDLSHLYPFPPNYKFVGILSRFQGMENIPANTDFEVVAIVSGIEPQRTIFEEQIIERFKNSDKKVLILRGKPQENTETEERGNIKLVSHLEDKALAAALKGADKIICRSGYSSIMDLKTLNCLDKAELSATPGQTEQEYLYSIHRKP